MAGLPRMSLRSFLALARGRLQTGLRPGSTQHLNFVIGNEGADLDSLTSSLLYAYIRSYNPPKSSPCPRSSLYIPLLNIPAADLRLRPEFHALLPHADISSKDLLTLDDLDFDGKENSETEKELLQRLEPGRTRWVLVDHNRMKGSLGKLYKERVVGCVDHHVEEEVVPREDVEVRVVEKCGSCSSLVVDALREEWDGMGSGMEDKIWDAEVARLALGSILIDTNELQAEDKVVDVDKRAVKYLEAKLRTREGGKGYDRAKFFAELRSAKESLDSLTVQEVLRKDYKAWPIEGCEQKLGVSAMVKPLEWIIKKSSGGGSPQQTQNTSNNSDDALCYEIQRFMVDNQLGLFGLMTTFSDDAGQFRRELLVWATGPDHVRAMEHFEKAAAKELGLTRWNGRCLDINRVGGVEERVKAWCQTRTQHSRKAVGPMLCDAAGSQKKKESLRADEKKTGSAAL